MRKWQLNKLQAVISWKRYIVQMQEKWNKTVRGMRL